jgi:hypothetical protein
MRDRVLSRANSPVNARGGRHSYARKGSFSRKRSYARSATSIVSMYSSLWAITSMDA